MSEHKHHRRKVEKKSQRKISSSPSVSNSKNKKKRQPKKRTFDAMGILLRIYPNSKAQEDYILRSCGCARLVYNKIVADYELKKEQSLKEWKNSETEHKYPKYGSKEGNTVLNLLKSKEEYSFLKDVHSKMLQQAVLNFSTALSNHIRFPEDFDEPVFKKKSRHNDSFRIPIDAIPGSNGKKGIQCVYGNRISICSELTDVLFKCSRRDEKYLNRNQKKIRSITVSVAPDGKMYASVLIASRNVDANDCDMICGLDLGLKEHTIEHHQKMFVDDDGFVSLADSEVEYVHMPNLNDYKDESEKERMLNKNGCTRLEHYNKKCRHWQKVLSRTEYNTNTRTTLRNKDNDKKRKYDRESFLNKRRLKNLAQYKLKRATTKPFGKKRKKNTSKQNTNVVSECNRPVWQYSSNRHERIRKRAAKWAAKIANKRSDYNHKITTRLVKENKMIVTENLNVSGMVKNGNLSKAIMNAGWSQFTQFLSYKAERYGRIYYKIGTFAASSKTCPVCEHKYKELTLAERTWTCRNCGAVINRDEGASDNIVSFGIEGYNEKHRAKLDELRMKDREPEL